MKKVCIPALLGILAVSAQTATAQTAYPEYSEWNSTYMAPQGFPVQARVRLHGTAGSYTTQQGAYGWLENIQIGPAPIPQPGITLATGTWRFYDGQVGWFKFHFNADWSSFTGIWGFAGSNVAYSWNGTRAYGAAPVASPPVVTNPPVVSNPPAVSNPPFNPPPARPPVRPPFAGGGGGGLPTISDPGRLPAGTQAQFDPRTGRTTFFNRQGRPIGQSPARRGR